MKHNFPTDVNIACLHVHNLKEGKQILKLAIDGDCNICQNTFNFVVDGTYPRFIYNCKTGNLSQTKSKIDNTENIWVSFEEFKAFLKGKGKYTKPFKEELLLNNSYKAVVTKEKITLGCQEFTHEKVKELYELSQKALKS